MLEKWKSSSLAEKIGIVGLFATGIALIVVGSLELFAENGAPNYALTSICCANMIFSAMINWSTQRKLAYINIGIAVVVAICTIVIAFVK